MYTEHDEQPNACGRHASDKLQLYADQFGKAYDAERNLTATRKLAEVIDDLKNERGFNWQYRWRCCGKAWFEKVFFKNYFFFVCLCILKTNEKGEIPAAHEPDESWDEDK